LQEISKTINKFKNELKYWGILKFYPKKSHGKLKTGAQPIFFICLPFAHRANGSLSFVVCPFIDEETNGSYPFANGLSGLAHLCTETVEI
jgi:hypothetical protein